MDYKLMQQTITPNSIPQYPEITSYEWSCTDTTHLFPVHNPATGKLITKIQGGNESTTKKAIAKAQAAFESWSILPATNRATYMLKCADILEKHKEELATLLCLENGKPMQDALMFDCTFVSQIFRYFGSLVDKLPSETYDRGAFLVTVVREPRGVCAGILPFNWPPIHTGGKASPALASGNTMILKPGEQAPLTVMRIVELLQTVLPEGVLQAVPGFGPEVPKTLCTSPIVKMVSFTGSTKTGAIIAKTCSDQVKPLALELGGKNAIVVFDDANLDKAVRDSLEGAFFNKGEACTASSRLYVQENAYPKFVEAFVAGVSKLKFGNGLAPDTHVGPCVSGDQAKRVRDYIEIGKNEGARVAFEGSLPDDPECKDGFFVKHVVFADVKPSMTVAQEEIFGPVVTIGSFRDEDEAVRIVNDSEYGLVASVFTRDMEKGLRVSRRMQAGMVLFNSYSRNVLGIPFGGVKGSGYGREHNIETLKEWTAPKFIQMPSGRGEVPNWRAVKACFGDMKIEDVNGV